MSSKRVVGSSVSVLISRRFKVYYRTSSFVGLGIAIKKVGLVDLMRVSERKNSRIAGRMNPVGFLDSTRITAAGLNNIVELT